MIEDSIRKSNRFMDNPATSEFVRTVSINMTQKQIKR